MDQGAEDVNKQLAISQKFVIAYGWEQASQDHAAQSTSRLDSSSSSSSSSSNIGWEGPGPVLLEAMAQSKVMPVAKLSLRQHPFLQRQYTKHSNDLGSTGTIDTGRQQSVIPVAAHAPLQCAACETLHCFNSVETYDPLRLTVGVSGWGLTGFEVARVLETRFHIVPELATQAVVLFMLGPGSALEDAHALVYAFEQLASEKGLQALPEASSDGTSSSVDALSCGNNGISRNRSSSSSSSSSSINHSNHSYDCDGSENGCGGSSTGRLGHSQTNLSIGRSIHVQHSPSKQFNTEPTSSNGHTHSRMNDTDGAGHGTSSISSIGLPHEQFIEHRQPEVRLSPRDALFASTHR
eukprot:1147432-Pelagomonas_calceolata.AAC.5